MILVQEALLRCFPVDELVMIERLELGPFSRGWLAQVKQSGQSQRWFVKQHRRKQKARLEFELQLQELLSRQGLDVIPAVIPTRSGMLWFACDDEYFSVHPFIDADPPSDWMKNAPLSTEKLHLAGAELAQFHDGCRRAQKALPASWQNQARPWLPQLQNSLNEALSKAEQRLPADDPIGKLAATGGQKIRRNLASCLAKLQSEQHERILIHGDYHPGNVLWRLGRIVAVLDFDYVQLGWPGYDVAYAAYMFGRDFQSPGIPHAGALSSFSEGYGIDPAAIDAFKLLPPVLVGYWLLEEYVEQPQLRETIFTALQTSLQDAVNLIGAGETAC